MSFISLFILFLIGNLGVVLTCLSFIFMNSFVLSILTLISTCVFYISFWLYLFELLRYYDDPEDPSKEYIEYTEEKHLKLVS